VTLLALGHLVLLWTNVCGDCTIAIERADGSCTGFVEIARVGPGVETYADWTVKAGQEYCYQVRAVFGQQRSDPSNQAGGRPDGPPGMGVT